MLSNLAPHSLQLWFSIVGDESTPIEQQTKRLLSFSEKKRLHSTKSDKKCREFLLSRALMRHALSHHFSVNESEWEFIERPNFIPEIKNLPNNIYFSLSHSNGLICFAITDSPVGLDLETIKQRDFYELANIFMNDDELNHLSKSAEEQAVVFYRIWCAKEAYYKMLPLSEQSSVSLKNISTSNLLIRGTKPFLLEWESKYFMLACVIKTIPEIINHHYFLSSIKLQLNPIKRSGYGQVIPSS